MQPLSRIKKFDITVIKFVTKNPSTAVFSIFVDFASVKFYKILKYRLHEIFASEFWNFYCTNLYLKIIIKLYCASKIVMFDFLKSRLPYLLQHRFQSFSTPPIWSRFLSLTCALLLATWFLSFWPNFQWFYC